MSISDKLANIQRKLKAPKSQYNSFGKYNYRSCEDILEAVKPFLTDCVLTIRDEVKNVGDIIFIESTAVFGDDKEEVKVSAQAGINPDRKGMDIAQSFGASSSYARKYALAGLFLLDDTKDVDGTNTHGKEEKRSEVKPPVSERKPVEKPSHPIEEYVDEIVTFDNAEGGSFEAMKLEMAKWCNARKDGIEDFKKITKGHFSNPLDIKSDKNIETAYKLWKKAIA